MKGKFYLIRVRFNQIREKESISLVKELEVYPNKSNLCLIQSKPLIRKY